MRAFNKGFFKDLVERQRGVVMTTCPPLSERGLREVGLCPPPRLFLSLIPVLFLSPCESKKAIRKKGRKGGEEEGVAFLLGECVCGE